MKVKRLKTGTIMRSKAEQHPAKVSGDHTMFHRVEWVIGYIKSSIKPVFIQEIHKEPSMAGLFVGRLKAFDH